MDQKESQEKKSKTRREFLIKSGKYALYASPIVASILVPRAGIYAASAPVTPTSTSA